MPVDPRVVRAREFLGTPFKLHGRDPAEGVDCVGLIALIGGRIDGVPTGYSMRNVQGGRWALEMDKVANRSTDGRYGPGDILLMQAGPAQYHLGCWSGDGLIHADARLRRVVETPGPVPWPILGVWRFSPTEVR
jgi:murein DD-endopeptidase / murein LD-carboxypeptidase